MIQIDDIKPGNYITPVSFCPKYVFDCKECNIILPPYPDNGGIVYHVLSVDLPYIFCREISRKSLFVLDVRALQFNRVGSEYVKAVVKVYHGVKPMPEDRQQSTNNGDLESVAL